MKPKIFFDFEGVITKNGRIIHERGHKLTKKVISLKELDYRYNKARIGKMSYEEFSQGFPKDFLKKYLQGVSFHKGAKKTIERLSKENELFIASNHVPFLFENEIRKLKIRKYFKKIFPSYSIGFAKPDIKFYETILKKANAIPEKSFFIDDAKRNLVIPKKLGMQTIWVNNEIEDKRNNFEVTPDYEIKDLAEIIKIIQKASK